MICFGLQPSPKISRTIISNEQKHALALHLWQNKSGRRLFKLWELKWRSIWRNDWVGRTDESC